MSKPYAIVVHLLDDTGSTHHQRFERREMALSREAFNAYAIGTMLTMVSTGYIDSLAFTPSQNGTTFPASIVRIGIDVIDDANTQEDCCKRFHDTYALGK